MITKAREWSVSVCLVASSLLWVSGNATSQTITVDAAPSHVANTFSPVRSLGAAIDRLRTGTPDHLLTGPGAQGDSGRGMANRDLSPEHGTDDRGVALEPARHVEQRGQTGRLFHGQCGTD